MIQDSVSTIEKLMEPLYEQMYGALPALPALDPHPFVLLTKGRFGFVRLNTLLIFHMYVHYNHSSCPYWTRSNPFLAWYPGGNRRQNQHSLFCVKMQSKLQLEPLWKASRIHNMGLMQEPFVQTESPYHHHQHHHHHGLSIQWFLKDCIIVLG